MKKFIIAGICVVAVAVTCACVYGSINTRRESIVKEVTIEAGTPIELDDFLTEPLTDCGFFTDVTGIDTSVPGSYGIVIKFSDFGIEFHQDAVYLGALLRKELAYLVVRLHRRHRFYEQRSPGG